jgi:hypothetical protein
VAPPPDRDDEDDTDRRPTAAELARHQRTHPHVVPAIQGQDVVAFDEDDDEDDSAPYDEQPNARDIAQLKRSGRDTDAPVTAIELSAMLRGLAKPLRRQLRRLRHVVDGDGSKERPGLVATVASHAQVIGPARSAASWALRGTIAAVLVVGGFLYWRGRDEQRVIDELAAVRKDNERFERVINQLVQNKDPKP